MWFSSFSYSEYICDAKKKIIVFYFPAVLLLISNISSSVNWGVPHGLHKIAPVSLSLNASIYRAHKLAYYSILLGSTGVLVELTRHFDVATRGRCVGGFTTARHRTLLFFHGKKITCEIR
jgi:hypothetical protein